MMVKQVIPYERSIWFVTTEATRAFIIYSRRNGRAIKMELSFGSIPMLPQDHFYVEIPANISMKPLCWPDLGHSDRDNSIYIKYDNWKNIVQDITNVKPSSWVEGDHLYVLPEIVADKFRCNQSLPTSETPG